MKHLKRLFPLLLTLGLALSLALGLAACGNDEPPAPDQETIEYTVFVQCDDASTLETLSVKILSGAQEVAKKELDKTTPDGGDIWSATFSLTPAVYTAELEGALDDFTYTPAALTPISTTATVTLRRRDEGGTPDEKIDYAVSVKLPSGNPVKNIIVQLCGGPTGACNTAETDASGVARFTLAAGLYEVHIEKNQWPAGYLFDDTEYTIDAAGGEIEVFFHETQTYTVLVYWVSYETNGGETEEIKGEAIPDLQIALYARPAGSALPQETPSATGVTDAQGKVALVAAKGEYLVRIVDCPATWQYDENAAVTAASPALDLKVRLPGPEKRLASPNAEEAFAPADWTSAYDRPAETAWTWLDPAATVVKDPNDIYHCGTADGPVVFAAMGAEQTPQGLTEPFPTANSKDADMTWSTGEPDANGVVMRYDMTAFFAQYAAASKEGLHPLTAELQKALQYYALSHGVAETLGWPEEDEQLFLFACGYYKSTYESATGAGTEDSPFCLTRYGKYKVTLPADGAVWYLAQTAGVVTFEEEGVTLTLNGKNYTNADMVPLSAADSGKTPFTFTAAAEKTFAFTFAPELGSEQNPYPFQEGENLVSVPKEKATEGVYYAFTPTVTAVYTVMTRGDAALVESPAALFPKLEGASNFTFTQEMAAGVTYLFRCAIAQGSEAEEYAVIFLRAASRAVAETEPHFVPGACEPSPTELASLPQGAAVLPPRISAIKRGFAL